jgi:hypothetical protein
MSDNACLQQLRRVVPRDKLVQSWSLSPMPQNHRTDKLPDLYDRALMLHGSKRNEVLTLAEIKRYGLDNFADADYISIYGMPPDEWYRHGIRVLGRTAVECTRDALGDRVGIDVASVAKRNVVESIRGDRSIRRFLQYSILDLATSDKLRGHWLRIRPAGVYPDTPQPRGDWTEDRPCPWRVCNAA